MVVATPAPVVAPVVEKEPEPEPEPKQEPEFVQGYRVQLMFLKRTPRPQADRLAKQAQTKLGLPVTVVSRSGALLLQAGNFIDESSARSAMMRIRQNGYRDAFLVRETVPKK